MAYHEKPRTGAEAKYDETLFDFPFRMVGIVDDHGVFIIEDRFGFFKGNLMLPLVDDILVFIPLKAQHVHNYIIIIA